MAETGAMAFVVVRVYTAMAGALLALVPAAVRADGVPLPRPRPDVAAKPAAPARWREPLSFREAAGAEFNSAAVTSAPSPCRIRLEKIATLSAMPRLIGPGICGGDDMVQLDSVTVDKGRRVEIKPAPLLRCEMAEQFALWVRDDVTPRVANSGRTLTSVDTYDDYSCRGRNRVFGAKVSEHGKGNAVDVRSLTFADKQVAMLTDKTFAKDIRSDLRASACARFTTVLGPGSDGYHEEHIHVDLAQRSNGYRICHWNVLEPPPPPPPPKPAEVSKAESDSAKPDEAQPDEAAPDTAAAEAKPDAPQRVEIALVDVPLPRARPPRKHRKVRHRVHFPFNLLR
ncbi:MAG: extensin family protein [Proteobacteria bacterium]|nr:extensin family protein [Pseudomonadota bacterium]